ncbi:sensory box histidine kinase/response regulator [Rhodobacteraceae bacterium KLH11]|nr:sensory box histidine kinase/response regulator [Rhodobacteraceae bacterium KLH11]
MKRWPIFAFIGLLSVGLVIVFSLGREVKSDLDALATSKTDNVSWLMSQLEVELLRLEVAVIDASKDADVDLSAVRNRFDIFYSRADTLSGSALFSFLREDAAAQSVLRATEDFKTRLIPLIDGPDRQLRVGLPELRMRIQALRPQIRELALGGIQGFAQENADRRAELAGTLIRLASLLVVLFIALLLAFAILVKLFRQGQLLARQSQSASNRFEAAITSSLDAVLVVDTSGRILEFNGAAEDVFGYTQAEAIGADMADLIVPEHLRDLHRKGMARFLETGEQKVIGAGRVRLEGLRKSQETFPVELSISLAETNGERVFVSFLRDITEDLKAEEDLRTARDKAQESEQAKSDLLTVMSHEMRTPLNGILGSAELIDRSNLTDRQKRHLHSIEVSGKLLLSHVTDVLDFSRLGSGNALRDKSNFDICKVVREVADSLTANADARGNDLKVDVLSEELCEVLGYRTALQQCLVNLLGNAIEFTRDGSVTIEVERLRHNDLVEFRIADTGVGISPEYLDVIFDEFVTIDTAFARDKSGTGLGLAITKRLAEAMGGDISADSVLGEGSLFSMRLPLPAFRSDMENELDTSEMPEASLQQGLKALVVDDNAINRMILTDMLADIGFEVAEAENGYAALERLGVEPFDVLLLDISMPGIDGIETLGKVRELNVSWRSLPAIAVTAHAAPKDHEAIRSAEFQGLLVKPVPLAALQSELAEVVKAQRVGITEPENDFRIRFGDDKFREACKELNKEVIDLIDSLNKSKELDIAHRQAAHKLCGSAAILGQNHLWSKLNGIQNCTSQGWDDERATFLRDLQYEAKRCR